MRTPPLPPDTLTFAQGAYSAWGLDTENLGEVQTPSHLSENLRLIRSRLADAPYRVTPASFDATDVEGYPLEASNTWTSLVLHASAWRPHALATILPHFWQTEPAVHRACRTAKIPLFVGEPENIPLCAAAIHTAGVNVVVGTPADLSRLCSLLAERNMRGLDAMLIVRAPDADSLHVPEILLRDPHCSVAQEIHVLPAMPLLVQCTRLADKKRPLYHVSGAFYIEPLDNELLVTSRSGPLPLVRYSVPLSLRKAAPCECGHDVFEITRAAASVSTE